LCIHWDLASFYIEEVSHCISLIRYPHHCWRGTGDQWRPMKSSCPQHLTQPHCKCLHILSATLGAVIISIINEMTLLVVALWVSTCHITCTAETKWYIIQIYNGPLSLSFVGKYTSSMEHMGLV
jgi:hypothetical protein